MKRLFALMIFILGCSNAFAWDWISMPVGVVSSPSGTTYMLAPVFIPTSNFTTYWIYVADELDGPWLGEAGFDATQTTSVQIKDASNNNVCSTPQSGYGNFTFGTQTIYLYSYYQACPANTLINGAIYTINISGKAFHYGGGSNYSTPQILVHLSAQ